MSGQAQVALLADGRLHLHHGPIDIVAEASGAPGAVRRAYAQAASRFRTILGELVAELDLLRRPLGERAPRPEGAVARRMVAACWPCRVRWITPMAAVAGAVADEVMAAMTAGVVLERAYANNGGDIALHLAPGQSLRAAVVADPGAPAVDATVMIDHAMPVRGIATSGWRGRSFSLGIADAVTVLAVSAAGADAAATLVANAVSCSHPAVRRQPARLLRDDSDLGDLAVTVAVGALPAATTEEALARGAWEAERLRAAGLIHAAGLLLQGRTRLVGASLVQRIEAAE
jgi:uncharacterized protein